MKKSLEAKVERVKLTEDCYSNMIRSTVETGSREVLGDLIGKKWGSNFILAHAYPIQTAERKPTAVSYGNDSARERLRRLNRVLGDLGCSIIGQYHSHIFAPEEERDNSLSQDDVNFSVQEMEALSLSSSVEIVLGVKSRNYKTRHKVGESIRQYPKGLRVILRDDLFHCYDIFISAFLVSKNKKIKELKVYRWGGD